MATNHVSLNPIQTISLPSARKAGRLLARALKGTRTALPAALASLLLNVFVAQAMTVQGPSMNPNLAYDQRVVVDKVTYHLAHSPRRGEVVVVDLPGESELLVKRVVGGP